jgi:hypothetical protein
MEHRRWDKRLAYEESLRIPMIVVYPGKIEAGSTISQMVSNVDFAPTVLSYAGVPIPELMQGASMRPLFDGTPTNWRDYVFYEYWIDLVHAIPTMKAVRSERFKLIQYPELDDIDELYDLERDPHEMNNLVQDPEYANVLQKMEKQMAIEAERVGWKIDVFPKNLPRVRGPEGLLLDLKAHSGKIRDTVEPNRRLTIDDVELSYGAMQFNGVNSVIKVPFNPDVDPSTWPYRIKVEVKAESDGVVATQSSPGYGFKLFIQDGRPGVSVICKTWIASRTTLDAHDSILNRWSTLEAEIDYNRVTFWLDGKLIESKGLPLPFKGQTKAPLLIGKGGPNVVSDSVPNNALKGQIRHLSIERNAPPLLTEN